MCSCCSHPRVYNLGPKNTHAVHCEADIAEAFAAAWDTHDMILVAQPYNKFSVLDARKSGDKGRKRDVQKLDIGSGDEVRAGRAAGCLMQQQSRACHPVGVNALGHCRPRCQAAPFGSTFWSDGLWWHAAFSNSLTPAAAVSESHPGQHVSAPLGSGGCA